MSTRRFMMKSKSNGNRHNQPYLTAPLDQVVFYANNIGLVPVEIRSNNPYRSVGLVEIKNGFPLLPSYEKGKEKKETIPKDISNKVKGDKPTEKMEEACVICLTNQASYLLTTCLHCVYCHACSKQIVTNKCPICKVVSDEMFQKSNI